MANTSFLCQPQRSAKMQHSLEGALDKLISPRLSVKTQKDALTTLERTLAELLLVEKQHLVQNDFSLFLQLQDSFQCNLASRIHPWLTYRTEALKKLGDRKICNSNDSEEEFVATTYLVIQALSLLQGVALIHKQSKEFLSKKSSIEVFIDLLSVCRHASAKPFANSTNTSPTKSTSIDYPWDPSLVSAVLDTLLCVLVDSPQALRCFEEARGIEHIVKILKRSAIPKDVRIKCLEFLYFYLLDESPSDSAFLLNINVPTRPSSPARYSKATPFDRSRVSTASSSSSNSSGSHSSTSSSSSWSPTPTLAGTPPVSPKKSSNSKLPEMHGPLDMLRKDVDFVPLSPKKAKVAQLDGANRRPGPHQHASPLQVPKTSGAFRHRQLSPLGRLASEETLLSESDIDSSICEDKRIASNEEGMKDLFSEGSNLVRTRTMEEKKEILGQLLGNVDALVEGVKKAGIWGLGG